MCLKGLGLGLQNFGRKCMSLIWMLASVNMSHHNGVATLLKNDLPWLLDVHCFNHRLELGIKDAMEGTHTTVISMKC